MAESAEHERLQILHAPIQSDRMACSTPAEPVRRPTPHGRIPVRVAQHAYPPIQPCEHEQSGGQAEPVRVRHDHTGHGSGHVTVSSDRIPYGGHGQTVTNPIIDIQHANVLYAHMLNVFSNSSNTGCQSSSPAALAEDAYRSPNMVSNRSGRSGRQYNAMRRS